MIDDMIRFSQNLISIPSILCVLVVPGPSSQGGVVGSLLSDTPRNHASQGGGDPGAIPSGHDRILGLHNPQSYQSANLPPLWKPVPNHVPQLSNSNLIQLWLNNQFFPILRAPTIQIQLCLAISQKRDLNPQRFDRNHPLIGRLLRDPTFFKYVLSKYNAHQGRFTFYHHKLIPLLRGCALMNEIPGSPPAV